MNLLPTHRPTHPLFPDISEFFANFPPMISRPMFESHLIRVEDQAEDHKYTVRAEIPGIDPAKDLDITVQDGVLTIKAERSEQSAGRTRSEFSYGSFVRAISLPSGADEAAITANYDKGILTVSVPVGEATKPQRHIQIGSVASAEGHADAHAAPAAESAATGSSSDR
jgi:HSP20 family molecular chaperone IbpA